MINCFLDTCKKLYDNKNENCLIIADEKLSNIFFYRIEVLKKNNETNSKDQSRLIYPESHMVHEDEYTILSKFDFPLDMINSLLDGIPILHLNNDQLGPKLSISDRLVNRLIQYYTPLIEVMEIKETLDEIEYMANISELGGIKETFFEQSIRIDINKSKEKAIDPLTLEAIIKGHLEDIDMEDRITFLVPDKYKTDEILDAGLLIMIAKEGISIEALEYAINIRNLNEIFIYGMDIIYPNCSS